MIKLIWRFALLTAIAAGFAWLADRPGVIMLRWLGREIDGHDPQAWFAALPLPLRRQITDCEVYEYVEVMP